MLNNKTVGMLCGLLLASWAMGQDNPSSNSVIELSPIRVIAPEERLERMAGTSNFTTGAIDLYQIQTVQETTALVPNLYVSSSDSRGFGDVISIRGIGNTIFFSSPGVSLYVDDVPSGDVFTYSSELNSGNTLTLHRGGRGSFFGRNGPAGVIEIQSIQPLEPFQSSLSVEAGSFDKLAFRANIAGELSGSDLSHSLSVYHNERDGYLNNALLNRKTDTREAQGGEWSFFWNPGNDWRVRLKAAAESIEDGSQRLSSLFSPDRFTVASDLEGETSIDKRQVSIHLMREFDWGLFKSISSLQDWELDPSTVDLDLSPDPISTSTIVQDQKLTTQEFRFESPASENDLHWRAGFFFMDKETDSDATRVFPAPPFFPVFTEQTISTLDETEISVFGHVAYQASETLTLDGGIRLQNTESSIDRSKTSPVGVVTIVDDVDETYFAPDAGFQLELSNELTLVGRSAVSFKPKGFSPFTDNPAIAAFEDEEAWSNEIGIVYLSPDSELSFRLTAFDISIDDFQLERSAPNSTDYIVVNADEVSSQGLETELMWQPFPRFQIEMGIGLSDVTFDSHVDVFTGANYSGLNAPFVPEYTIRGSVQYNFENGLFVQGAFRAIGATNYDEANNPLFRQGDYNVFDAQFGYRGERFSIAVYGKNIGDEFYYNFINPQVFAGTPGDPEVFGARFDAKF